MASIIRQNYEIVTLADWDKLKGHVERCGRICYKSEDRIADNSADKFIKTLINSGHESVIEHVPITVFITTDRGISHELVRHRLASPSQESTRYCNYSKDKFDNEITFIDITQAIELDRGMMKDLSKDTIVEIVETWMQACMDSERHYNRMIELGASPQIARSVLNNSTKTDIVITANIRQWREMFRQRISKAAHPMMRALMMPILMDLQKEAFPFFSDINLLGGCHNE